MLIRMGTAADQPAWIALAESVSGIFEAPGMPTDPGFLTFLNNKLARGEALIAQDRRSGRVLGALGFSRAHNRISWLAVHEDARGHGVGGKLLTCALRQLDAGQAVEVTTFCADYAPGAAARALYEKYGFVEIGPAPVSPGEPPRAIYRRAPDGERHGGSFHYRYDRYRAWAQPEHCPVCAAEPSPEPPACIWESENAWLECYEWAQGRLFGKCHVLSKVHSEHFYDMDEGAMAAFMADVQRAARALHAVTGAVKINYEIHGNSMPHLHVHLFPRYLDDDFPSAPIDYRQEEPSPYEDHQEYVWFIERMREALAR